MTSSNYTLRNVVFKLSVLEAILKKKFKKVLISLKFLDTALLQFKLNQDNFLIHSEDYLLNVRDISTLFHFTQTHILFLVVDDVTDDIVVLRCVVDACFS